MSIAQLESPDFVREPLAVRALLWLGRAALWTLGSALVLFLLAIFIPPC